MQHIEIAAILDSNTLRTEKIILIAGATSCGTLTQDMENFIEEHTIEEIMQIIPDLPEWVEDEGKESLLEAIGAAVKYGYLVQFATPVRTYNKRFPNAASYSWGACYVKWIYGESMEEAVKKAVFWAREMREKDKQKAIG